MTIKIDQDLKVALQAGKKNNIFIYHAPRANVSGHGGRKEYDGALQILYAICSELLDQEGGITIKEWVRVARAMMLKAAADKYSSKLAGARALGIQEFKSKDIAILEDL